MTRSFDDYGGPSLPATLGRYRLLRVLGEGGMGRVYEAELAGAFDFARRVAVKVLLGDDPEDTEGRRRLISEARLGALLNHPNLVQVLDCDALDGVPYIAMELVPGLDLRALMKTRQAVPPALALEVAVQVCQGLRHLHEATHEGKPLGLVHRDLKPANLMVRPDGLVKVMDLGLIKASQSNASSTGHAVGTPIYMAPEVLRGGAATPASDLFALGAVLVEMLLGAPLFAASSIPAVTWRIIRVEETLRDEAVRERVDALVPGLGVLVEELLSASPEDRPSSARELEARLVSLRGPASLADALGDFAGTGEPVRGVEAYASTVGPPLDRRPPARRTALGVAAAAIVILAVAFGARQWLIRGPVGTELLELEPAREVPGAPGGTVRVVAEWNPRATDSLSISGESLMLRALVDCPLARQQRVDPTRLAAGSATSALVSEDGLTYTITLRDDLLWHEPPKRLRAPKRPGLAGRRPVTASDLALVLELHAAGTGPRVSAHRTLLPELSGWRVLDEHTLELSLIEPENPVFLTRFSPLPRHLYSIDAGGHPLDVEGMAAAAEDPWWRPAMLGCGPFRYVEQGSERVVLERDDLHPYPALLDGVTALIGLETDEALRDRRVDIGWLSGRMYRQSVLSAPPTSPFRDGTFVEGEVRGSGGNRSSNFFFVAWNHARPQFWDRRARLGLAHTVRADEFLATGIMGPGRRTVGPFGPNSPHHDPTLSPVPFDLDTARALLDAAGWVDADGDGIRERVIDGSSVDFEFRILVVEAKYSDWSHIARPWAEDLLQVGVRMTVEEVPWTALTSRGRAGDFDAAIIGWSPVSPWHLLEPFHSAHRPQAPMWAGDGGYRNTAVDRAAEMLSVASPADRPAAGRRLQRLLHEEQPLLFLYERVEKLFWRPELTGVDLSSTLRADAPVLDPRDWALQPTE